MVISAVNEPVVAGANVDSKVQLAPDPSVVPQPLVNVKSAVEGPVNAMLVSVTGFVPGFVSVIDCAVLTVPLMCDPKIKFGGVKVRTVAAEGAGGLAIANPNGAVIGMVVVSSVSVDV